MEETQPPVPTNVPAKRSARILQKKNHGEPKEQNTAERNANDTVDQPRIKRLRPETSSSTASTPPLFFEKPVQVAFQVSQRCRIGPIFDKNRILSLAPYESMPYPEHYVRIVQDLLRCAHRPEVVFKAIKGATSGGVLPTITFFDETEDKLEYKSIPVSENINSAQKWLSELLESVGCCKNLFLPLFLAKQFVCKECYSVNANNGVSGEVSREQGFSGNRMAADDVRDDEQAETSEAERKQKEEKEKKEQAKRAKKQRKMEEDKEKMEKLMRQRKAWEWDLEESVKNENMKKKFKEWKEVVQTWTERGTLEDNERQRLQKLKSNGRSLSDQIKYAYLQNEVEEEHTKRYMNINSIFMTLFKIPQQRTELRPDLENTITSKSPGVSFEHFVRVKVFFEGEKELWQLGEEDPIDSSIFKSIKTHSCTGVHSDITISGTMMELWYSLLLHCPKCLTKFHWNQALDKVRYFIDGEEEKRRKKLESIEAEKIYMNIHAFFLNLFPGGRNIIRPDLGNPIVSNCPELDAVNEIKAETYRDGGTEMWQLGSEKPANSFQLKEIKIHRCLGVRSCINLKGTLLELWESLLLQCHKCVHIDTLLLALVKIKEFMKADSSTDSAEDVKPVIAEIRCPVKAKVTDVPPRLSRAPRK